MKTFKQYIIEGINLEVKGWIHPKKKKVYLTKSMRPYHVEFVAKKPRDFGITEKNILDVLEKWNDSMDAPEPAEDAKNDLAQIKKGSIDKQKLVEYLAMKKGWYRVVGADWSEITGLKIDDKIIHDILNIMEDKRVIPYDGKGIKSIICGEYRLDGDYPSEKSIKILEGDAILRALRGKKTGKRTDIGRTMAMFREAVNECWSTHVQRGYKKKGGKMVPNCVPKNEDIEEGVKDIIRKLGKNKKVMSLVSKLRGQSAAKLAATLATIPIVQDTISSPDRMNQLRVIANGLRSMTEEDND